jgi:polysaccharide export outer membrane protein
VIFAAATERRVRPQASRAIHHNDPSLRFMNAISVAAYQEPAESPPNTPPAGEGELFGPQTPPSDSPPPMTDTTPMPMTDIAPMTNPPAAAPESSTPMTTQPHTTQPETTQAETTTPMPPAAAPRSDLVHPADPQASPPVQTPAAPVPSVAKSAAANAAATHHGPTGWAGPAPRELNKTILPDYRIEPPDVLQIDAIHLVPKAPYRLRALDSLQIYAAGALQDAPISGLYPIEPGGFVNLNAPYGKIQVGGKTAEEAKIVIEKHLAGHLNDPQATVNLGEIATKQQIAGPHLVGPDGAITLGGYGKVSVVGKTVGQAKAAIEQHLSKTLDEPEISVDVYAYNSKVYYIVLQGAGQGDGVSRFPVTGNETVLDAISQVNGLSPNSSTRIWVARPGRNSRGCHQILPVNWEAITQCADWQTNYQLMPGDRVYVAADKLVAFDTALGKLIAPAERLFGFVALGTSTISSVQFYKQRGQRGDSGGF